MLEWMFRNARPLTLNVVASHELQHLINEDDGEGKLQDYHPLLCTQMGQLEDHLGGKKSRSQNCWETIVQTIVATTTKKYSSKRTILQYDSLNWEIYTACS